MGTDPEREITLSPSDFQGPQSRTGHRKRRGAFTRKRPYSGRADSRDRTQLLQNEKSNSSPGPRRRLRFCVRYRTWCPKLTYLVSVLGNIKPHSLSVAERDKNEHVFAFAADVSLRTGFSIP
ncbi:hypothetical protein JTE90_002216 [Oedothorax gibbosus]|uniref:Uncharacterized protein n=1 Tax=Oedothorax gibbosus TaxID=931172 RepID=A0AAV6TD86_9ARAC|nr:hypothetical protein JTE90_002216 [Oedothorax gibbosus]